MGGATGPIVEALSNAALATANEDNAVAFSEWARGVPGVEVDHRPDRFRISTGIPHPIFNGVRSARLSPAEADAYIDETVAYFAARAERWFWWVWPSGLPGNFSERLRAHGLESYDPLPAMSLDLRSLREDPRPEGLTIVRVTDAAMFGEWARLAGGIFGLPAGAPTQRFVEVFSASGFNADAPMQFYTGYLHDVPVAASQMFLGAGVAGIHTVATLPEYRRRGYGAALTVAPLLDGRARGYRWGVLQATKMGEPVYLRLGFQVVAHVVFCAPPPPKS